MNAQGKPDETPRYTVSDEIRVGVELTHRANIEEVRVIFARIVGFTHSTITLIGGIDEDPEVEHSPGALSPKTSHAALVTLVDVDHRPGPYFFHELVLRTASGSLIRMPASVEDKQRTGPAFHVAEEPHDAIDFLVDVGLHPEGAEDG